MFCSSIPSANPKTRLGFQGSMGKMENERVYLWQDLGRVRARSWSTMACISQNRVRIHNTPLEDHKRSSTEPERDGVSRPSKLSLPSLLSLLALLALPRFLLLGMGLTKPSTGHLENLEFCNFVSREKGIGFNCPENLIVGNSGPTFWAAIRWVQGPLTNGTWQDVIGFSLEVLCTSLLLIFYRCSNWHLNNGIFNLINTILFGLCYIHYL